MAGKLIDRYRQIRVEGTRAFTCNVGVVKHPSSAMLRAQTGREALFCRMDGFRTAVPLGRMSELKPIDQLYICFAVTAVGTQFRRGWRIRLCLRSKSKNTRRFFAALLAARVTFPSFRSSASTRN
jgi:hypothetical protein